MSVDELNAALQQLQDQPSDVEVATGLYQSILTASAEELDAADLRPRAESVGTGWRRNNLRMDRPPTSIVKPSSREECLEALVSSTRAKAIGNGWGFSSAGQTSGSLLVMAERANGMRSIDVDLLTPRAAGRLDSLCCFGGGTTIRTLNGVLYERHRALWNAPGYEELTFVGVMSSGGHGSGTWLGPLADQVRSMELVTLGSGGAKRVLRVEPTDGITDPVKFNGRYGQSVELRQDDELFRACLVGLGALGVITEVTIDVRPAYQLEESRRLLSWDEVAEQLPSLLRDQGPEKRFHSIELWVNPYPIHGQVRCLLGTKAWTEQANRGERGIGIRKASASTFAMLSRVMRAIPEAIPVMLHAGLWLSRAEHVVMPSSKALDFGRPNGASVTPAAVGIPIDDSLSGNISDLLRFLQARRRDEHRWVTSPLGIRFVGASRAWLAPTYGQPTCVIEMPLLSGTEGAAKTLQKFHEWSRDRRGRPHWGLLHELSPAQLREAYPAENLRAFRKAFTALNEPHLFDNDFTERLELSGGLTEDGRSHPSRSAASIGSTTYTSWSRLFSDQPGSAVVPLPGDEHAVLALLKDAKEKRRKLVLRAGGNSLHTQALGDAAKGDSYLRSVERGAIHFHQDAQGAWLVTATAGVRWGELIDAALARRLVPKVVVTTPYSTVGGTLSSNSIGQASRRFGHEADGVVSIRLALPRAAGEEPEIRVLMRPLPGTTGEDAELFRAAIGGYGLVGVILEATYELNQIPADAHAVTRVEAFDAKVQLADALEALDGSRADDGLFKSCTLFRAKKGWVAGVVATSFEAHDRGPSLLPYAGDTFLRRASEALLCFMPTAHLAHQIAASVIERASQKKTEHVDPVRGFLFLMEANHNFKRSLPDFLAATVQQTFVLPSAASAKAFLEGAFTRLEGTEVTELADAEIEEISDQEPEVIAALAEIERSALEADGLFPSVTEPEIELARSLLRRAGKQKSVLPALFEMIWVREDQQILSATHKQSGFAISLTFQGWGVSDKGPLFGFFKKIHHQIYVVLESLSSLCLDLGGRVHLTKNIFVGKDPKAFVSRMLGSRLAEFNALRRLHDPLGVLTSRFAKDLFDPRQSPLLPAPDPAPAAPGSEEKKALPSTGARKVVAKSSPRTPGARSRKHKP